MKLTRIAGDCGEGRTCPTVYTTDRGTLVVQGYRLDAEALAEIDLPENESAVEIPLTLLKEAVSVHGG